MYSVLQLPKCFVQVSLTQQAPHVRPEHASILSAPCTEETRVFGYQRVNANLFLIDPLLSVQFMGQL